MRLDLQQGSGRHCLVLAMVVEACASLCKPLDQPHEAAPILTMRKGWKQRFTLSSRQLAQACLQIMQYIWSLGDKRHLLGEWSAVVNIRIQFSQLIAESSGIRIGRFSEFQGPPIVQQIRHCMPE